MPIDARGFQSQMRRIEHIVFSIVLLMVTTLAAIAARQSPVLKPGTLEGTVVDSLTGDPIPEARIRLSGIDQAAYEKLKGELTAQQITIPDRGSLSLGAFIQSVNDLADSKSLPTNDRRKLADAVNAFRFQSESRFDGDAQFSDPAGRFTVGSLLPGEYTIRVQSEGYFAPEPVPTVSVSADGPATVNVRMIPGGTIAGHVTSGGKPQPGVTVRAFQIGYLHGYPVMSLAASRVTDDRGQYRLFYLRPGEYLIAATMGDTFGDPLQIRAYETTPGSPSSTSTGSTEERPVRTFYPGTVDASAAERVLVRAGRGVVDVDIQLKTSRFFRVSGEIRVPRPATSAGAEDRPGVPEGAMPATSAHLRGALHDPNAPDDIEGIFIQGRIFLRPAGDYLVGTFQAINVPPGVYDWTVNGVAIDGKEMPETILPVEVRGTDVEGFRFDLRPGTTVKGTMTVDGGPPGANKDYVRLQIVGVRSVTRFDLSADEKTGAFSVPDVPVAHFRAIPTDRLPPNLYIDDVRSEGQSVFDAGFDVSTEPLPIEVLLRSGAATISGSVIDDAGKPAAGASVSLVPDIARRQNLALFHDVYADPDGKFSIPGVAPGEYKLFAWPHASLSGAAYNPAFLSRFEEKGVPVTISGKSSTVTVDLTAISPQVQ